MPSNRKSYAQVCPMANALDVVGDRWTPLILRELLGGPARFNELLDGLPGVAKNLLAARLRRLEEDGVVRRASGGGAQLYALTEQGAAVRPILEQLGFWGARLPRVGPKEHPRSVRATAMALHAIVTHAGGAMPADRVVVELDVDGQPVEVVLGPRPSVTVRPVTDAAGRLRVPLAALAGYLRGESLTEEHLSVVAGDPGLRAQVLAALGA